MARILSGIWNSRYDKYLLPLSFCLGNLVNVFFYYLGLAFEENIARQAGFIVANVLFTAVAFAALLAALRFGQLALRSLLGLGAVLIFFAGCYLSALLRFGLTHTWMYSAGQFVFFCFPAFCAGVYAARKRQEAGFFEVLEQMGFLAAPAALIYVNGAVFNCNPFNWGRDLGIVSYMSFAYMLMPFLMAMIFRFLESQPLAVLGRELKHPQRVRGVLIALYWIAMIASGTRGTYFCVIGFCICVLFSACLHRGARKRAAVLTVSIIFVLSFNLFIWAPQGFNTDRMTEFFQGLTRGEIVTSDEDPTVSDHIDALVKENGGHRVTNLPETPSKSNSTEAPSLSEPDTTDDSTDKNIEIKSRDTLFKLALGEFRKAPLMGMGPMGYSVKYSMYPHNVLLQLLCETGLIGFLFLLALVLWAVIRLLRIGWKQADVRCTLLFLIAYVIEANISGDLWYFPPLLCALGYGLAVPGGTASVDSVLPETTGAAGANAQHGY